MTDYRAKIAAELYKAVEALDATPELLCIIGSYGYTLSDEDVLNALTTYNQIGSPLLPINNLH